MNDNNKYWESYLVRFLVPTIVTALCLIFLAMSGRFSTLGINRFIPSNGNQIEISKTTITSNSNTSYSEITTLKLTANYNQKIKTEAEQPSNLLQYLKDKFDTTSWIIFGIVCFAIQYLVSAISMLIFAFRKPIYDYFIHKKWRFWFLFSFVYIFLPIILVFWSTNWRAFTIIDIINFCHSCCVTLIPMVIFLLGIFLLVPATLLYWLTSVINWSSIYDFYIDKYKTKNDNQKSQASILFNWFLACKCGIDEDKTKKESKDQQLQILTSFSHFREHGAAFHNSFLVFCLSMIFYRIGDYTSTANFTQTKLLAIIFLIICIIGIISGFILGMYLEIKYIASKAEEIK